MTYQYRTKKPYTIAYIIIILIGISLTLGRWYSVFNQNFVIINAQVHSHISNFSFSMIVYAGIGYSWLLFGRSLRFIQLLGVCLIAGNLICETLMDFLNTTDIIDALYGTVGIVVAYIYLFFTYQYGRTERLQNNE